MQERIPIKGAFMVPCVVRPRRSSANLKRHGRPNRKLNRCVSLCVKALTVLDSRLDRLGLPRLLGHRSGRWKRGLERGHLLTVRRLRLSHHLVFPLPPFLLFRSHALHGRRNGRVGRAPAHQLGARLEPLNRGHDRRVSHIPRGHRPRGVLGRAQPGHRHALRTLRRRRMIEGITTAWGSGREGRMSAMARRRRGKVRNVRLWSLTVPEWRPWDRAVGQCRRWDTRKRANIVIALRR